MPGKDIEQLSEILSLILDELRTTRKIANLEAESAERVWPTLAEIEGVYIRHVLRHMRGNKQAASRILDVDRKTIDRMITRHKIELG